MRRLIAYLQRVDRKWLTTWILIYVGFVILDAFFDDFVGITILKMLGIILCVVYAYQKFRADALLTLALGFTLVADTILMLDNGSILGVAVFSVSQFFHTARFKKTKPTYLLVYAAIVSAVFVILVLLGVPPMYVMAGAYAYSIFNNFYLATRWYFAARSTASVCAAGGFALFILCDICVATAYLGATGVLPLHFKRYGDYFAWLFYYPSQVLISNSSELLDKEAGETLEKLAADAKPVL